eukprot:3390684-Alexandrium_andersonii.AAC.1
MQRALRKCAGKAQGCDGWRAEEVEILPERVIQELCEMFEVFERVGWPKALKRWRQTHIPKDTGPIPLILRLKPIAIAS